MVCISRVLHTINTHIVAKNVLEYTEKYEYSVTDHLVISRR